MWSQLILIQQIQLDLLGIVHIEMAAKQDLTKSQLDDLDPVWLMKHVRSKQQLPQFKGKTSVGVLWTAMHF